MFKKIKIMLLLTLSMSAATVQVWAVEDINTFENAEQEQRYKDMIATLRCPKCLNANLAGSDAEIAADLRAEIYDQIIEGQSDEQILAFMTDRYGDFINYSPPLNKGTFLLWFGPGFLLLMGFIIGLRIIRNSQRGNMGATLSQAEEQKLKGLLLSQLPSQLPSHLPSHSDS